MDREMITRMAIDNGWHSEGVGQRYSHGVDWSKLRSLMCEKVSPIDGREKRALIVAACGGFWPEERRWRKGISERPNCGDCNAPEATARHRIHECDSLVAKEVSWRLLDLIDKRPENMDDADLAPLVCMALPPVTRPWTPIELDYSEGEISMGHERVHGDGSGYLQQSRSMRASTWALVAMSKNGDEDQPEEQMRGVVAGWMPTVPRAEARAFIEHARRAGPGAVFVSDCRYVVDTVIDDIPLSRTTSRDINADLWREARQIRLDHGAGLTAVKVKAHRSQRAAEQGLHENDLIDWRGNDAADRHARELCRGIVGSDGREAEAARSSYVHRQIMIRVAKGVAAAFERWPQAQGCTQHRDEAEADDGRQIPAEERHLLRRAHDGGMECAICRRTARGGAGRRRLEREACEGEIANKIDASHALRQSNGITWCTRCGCYTSRWPRALLLVCHGRPRTVAQANVLRRLQCGLPPTTADYLHAVAEHEGQPAHATAHQAEVEWRAAGGDVDTPNEVNADVNLGKPGRKRRTSSAPPAGRYHRLVGGALHVPTASPGAGNERRPGAEPHGDAARPRHQGGYDDAARPQVHHESALALHHHSPIPPPVVATPLAVLHRDHVIMVSTTLDDPHDERMHVKSTQVGMNTRTETSPGGVSRDGAASLYDLAALSDRDNEDMSAEVCQDAEEGAADANAARSSWERAAVEQERMMIDDASTLNDTRRECAEELRVQLPSVPEHFSSSSAAVTTSPSLVVSESGFPQRRRLRGKQSVSSKLAPNVNAIGTAARAECSPGHSSQWAGRLRIQAESIFRPCNVCVKLTRILCRGCSLPICFDCARKRVQCSRRI